VKPAHCGPAASAEARRVDRVVGAVDLLAGDGVGHLGDAAVVLRGGVSVGA
jgi:hypothetical protein